MNRNMEVFKTHPSVRVKGTEDNYEPCPCTRANCLITSSHFHCPFCVKSETFQDPVILKAHYRVKHVDKGIDFAGLKILRCCDSCMIIGSIKGNKEFKGAHWHCYNCRNGFNRRDEALKHYKTHFRNPMTTFQIQITQNINEPWNIYEATEVQNQELWNVPAGDQNSLSNIHGISSWIMPTETVISSYSDTNVETVPGQLDVGSTMPEESVESRPEQMNEVEIYENAHYYIVGEEGQVCAAECSDETIIPTVNEEQELEILKRKCRSLEEEKKQMETRYKALVEKLKQEKEDQRQQLCHIQARERKLLLQIEQLQKGEVNCIDDEGKNSVESVGRKPQVLLCAQNNTAVGEREVSQSIEQNTLVASDKFHSFANKSKVKKVIYIQKRLSPSNIKSTVQNKANNPTKMKVMFIQNAECTDEAIQPSGTLTLDKVSNSDSNITQYDTTDSIVGQQQIQNNLSNYIITSSSAMEIADDDIVTSALSFHPQSANEIVINDNDVERNTSSSPVCVEISALSEEDSDTHECAKRQRVITDLSDLN